VFNFNRHAITAGAIDKYVGGYVAHDNLILKGGGYHGSLLEEYTQIFDVHGDDNCPHAIAPKGWWNCGFSGQRYTINDNAFQYTNGYSFKVRGTPKEGAFVHNNVFASSDPLATGGFGTVGLYDQSNTKGVDSYGHDGACDFNGDGKDDLFLATGVNWWYMSGARHQWNFLLSDTTPMDQVAVGDFDGDARCEVFKVAGSNWLLWSPTTGNWRQLGAVGVPFDELRFGHFTGSKKVDFFRRAPDGQWFVMSIGTQGVVSTPVGSSGFTLDQLRFGDFNGDGVTDVLALEGGHWSVSWSATSPWQPLNPSLSDSLASVVIGDVDGDGRDDVVQSTNGGKQWNVSLGGRTQWQSLATSSVRLSHPIIGHFDGAARLIAVDDSRLGWIADFGSHTFARYGDFAR
jgi:hypothetical protein